MTNKDIDVTSDKMPKALKQKLEKLTPMVRKYAEYRAKGLTQPEAAKRAGSKASKSSRSLQRAGWNMEQHDGVKEYILWLEHKRAQHFVIEDGELITMLRDVYQEAMANNKFNDANKAVENLAKISGAIGNKPTLSGVKVPDLDKNKNKNNTKAFKEEYEEGDMAERIKRMKNLIKNSP